MTLPTESFPPLSGEYVAERDSVYKTGTRKAERVSSIGSQAFYDNSSQEERLIIELTNNNIDNYLKDYIDYDYGVLFSGEKPDIATSTFGLLKSNVGSDKFVLESLPNIDEGAGESLKRGKFKTQADYDIAAETPPSSYASFSYMEMSDGVAAPTSRQVNTSFFGVNEYVDEEIRDTVESFNLPNYGNPSVPINTTESGGSIFNSNPFAKDRYPSAPDDEYKSPKPDTTTEEEEEEGVSTTRPPVDFADTSPPQDQILFISSRPST